MTDLDSEPGSYSFERYLEAKRTVDSRGLNQRVLAVLRDRLDDMAPGPRILELGAGTGPTIERALEWPLHGHVQYTAVESDSDLVETAVENVADAARRNGLPCERSGRSLRIDATTKFDGGDDGPQGVVDGHDPRWESFAVECRAKDGLAVLDRSDREWDLLVAQAFVDLTDVEAALNAAFEALRPAGLAYFPITFDGTTAFVPVDSDLDARIERQYHRHMDSTEKAGGYTGDSHAGRHLLEAVPEVGGRVLAAGGSDWLVRPTETGYVGDEAYFLHHIVETVQSALVDGGVIDPGRVNEWARRRHRQIEAAALTYLTHQLDVLVRAPDE